MEVNLVKKRKISPSQLNQFYQCPFKWKLLHLDKVQTIKVRNEKADLGKNIHEIIALYYKNIGGNPTSKQIENVVLACFNTHFEPYLSKLKLQAEEMMGNFVKFEKSRLNHYVHPSVVEKEFNSEDFKGIIDYFDGENIIDWKTGAMMQIGNEHMRQGKIYEILLRHNGYIKDGQKIKISFVTLKNGRTLTLPLVTESWIIEQKRRMDFIISTQRFQKIRSGLCNWCECQLVCDFESSGERLWTSARLTAI